MLWLTHHYTRQSLQTTIEKRKVKFFVIPRSFILCIEVKSKREFYMVFWINQKCQFQWYVRFQTLVEMYFVKGAKTHRFARDFHKNVFMQVYPAILRSRPGNVTSIVEDCPTQ